MIAASLPSRSAPTRASGRRLAEAARDRWSSPRRPDPELPAAVTRIASWNAPALSADRPADVLRIGSRLAGTPYLVVGLVGQGGMGEVYEVEHLDLGRRAAIKVLHRNHADRPDLAARLREEARLAARLRHPNLVEVFDLGVTADGRPYFAMPRLSGRDLREELSRAGARPLGQAIGWIIQALDGLAAAHAAGLVHRDIKLENLFLEDDGTLKVLDFGVAKVVRAGPEATDPGGSPGTPRTMAPEQCAGARVDRRADVYAVGLALYELCAGRGPFDDLRGNDHALRFAHCERAPLPPSRLAPRPIAPELDAIILRALAKAPEDRFQSAGEMAEALRRLRDRSEATPAPAQDRAWSAAAILALAAAWFALGCALGRALPGPAPPGPEPAYRLGSASAGASGHVSDALRA